MYSRRPQHPHPQQGRGACAATEEEGFLAQGRGAVPPYGVADRLQKTGSSDHGGAATWRLAASSVGFLADSYDLFTIDIVLLILGFLYGESVIGPQAKSAMVSCMLLGTIAGQLFFGIVADRVGRKWCFVTTAGLTVVGALLSSAVHAGSIPFQLACCRFLLGFGVGGEYPLSATVTAEVSSDPTKRGYLMAIVISMQGFGMLLSCLIAILVTQMNFSLDFTWRFLLAFGALPSMAAFLLRWHMHESQSFRAVQQSSQALAIHGPFNTSDALRKFGPTLIGTSVCWMMMNLSLYSMGSFKSSILNEVMPTDGLDEKHKVLNAALFAAITSMFAITGFGVAILNINRIGRFRMQLLGFTMLALIFAVLSAISTSTGVRGSAMVYLGLLGVMFLFQNFGPNTTTFIIPAEAFPTRMRATCHGISAASGKMGALLGTAALPIVEASSGMASVYAACAGAALFGAAFTWLLTPRDPAEPAQVDVMQ